MTSDSNLCSTEFLTLSLKKAHQWKWQSHLTNSLKNFKQAWEKSRPGTDHVYLSTACTREGNYSWAWEGRKPLDGLHCWAGASLPARLGVTVTTGGGFPAGSGGKWWAGLTEPLQRPWRTPSFFMPEDVLWIGRGTQARYGLIRSVSGKGNTAEEVQGHTQAHWSPGFIKPHCLWNVFTGNSAK